MKKIFTLALTAITFPFLASAQSSFDRVYEVLQQKCVQCHNHNDPAGTLDLEGAGGTLSQKKADVYDNIFMANPENSTAVTHGDKLIYPGRADKSFLFRKINGGLEPGILLNSGEGQPMPAYGAQEQLTVEEKELIRQWLLFGAPENGTVADEDLIHDYYNTNGMDAFPDGAPEAPDPADGFQVKVGPFFIEPAGEVEFFTKYELGLPENVDVDRIEVIIPTFSHHFIIYNFTGNGDVPIPHGFRVDADHSDISLVAAVQEAIDLQLPQGSAFIWDQNMVLDLNTHTINYSAAHTYKAEAYVNVYTKPAGTAAQQMHTALIVNSDIYIPNNGNEVTHTQSVWVDGANDIYLWGMMGHVHKYGTGYKVYERLPGNTQGELLYDASCANGVPGCVSPYFDYQHIPMRYFEPLRQLKFDTQYGIIHEATWINDGQSPVWWGPTSNDEMMVMIMMYLLDTEGVTTEAFDPENTLEGLQVFPNPAEESFSIQLPPSVQRAELLMYDLYGKQVMAIDNLSAGVNAISRFALPSGIYYYHIQDAQGRGQSGKIVLR